MKSAPVLALILLMAQISTAMGGDLPVARNFRPEQLREKWQKAFAESDSKTLAEMYWPDADLLPPGGQKKTGSADIKKFWDEQTAKFVKPSIGASRLVVVNSNYVVETGLLTFEHKTPAAQVPRKAFFGHYVVVWRKTKNIWKIAVDTWNSSEFSRAPLP